MPRAKIEIARLKMHRDPDGRPVLTGYLGEMRIEIAEDREQELIPGVFRDFVMVGMSKSHPAPRVKRKPAQPRKPTTPKAARPSAPAMIDTAARMSDAARLAAAAADVRFRLGAIPPGGDSLDDVFPASRDPDAAEAIRLLGVPLC